MEHSLYPVPPRFTVRRLVLMDLAAICTLYGACGRDTAWGTRETLAALFGEGEWWGGFLGGELVVCCACVPARSATPQAAALRGALAPARLPARFLLPPAATPEGRLVYWADHIAYVNHDIDDAIRAGVLRESDLPPIVPAVLGSRHSVRINTMIWSMLEGSVQGDVGMTPPVLEAYETLHAFLFDRVYFNPVAKAEEGKAKQAIGALFEHFMQKPQELPQEYQNYMEQDGLERVVLDYISGMTDRYCIARFEEIFVAKVWR